MEYCVIKISVEISQKILPWNMAKDVMTNQGLPHASEYCDSDESTDHRGIEPSYTIWT